MAGKMEKPAVEQGLQAPLAAEGGTRRPPCSHPSWVSCQRSGEGAGGSTAGCLQAPGPLRPPQAHCSSPGTNPGRAARHSGGGEQGAAAGAPPAPWNRRYLKRALRLRPPGPGPSSRGGWSPGPRPPAPPRGLWTCTLTFRRSTRGTAGLGRGWQHLTISPRGAPVLGEPRTDTWWAAPGALAFVSPPSSLPPSASLLQAGAGPPGRPHGPSRLAPRRRLRCTGYKSGGYCKDSSGHRPAPARGPLPPVWPPAGLLGPWQGETRRLWVPGTGGNLSRDSWRSPSLGPRPPGT